MPSSVKELIKKRKSVRTFEEKRIEANDLKSLEDYVRELNNPFDIPVEFRLLDAKEYGLSSPVITGADMYLAAKIKRVENFEIAFGYSFEAACLYALSLGMGTVMLAASLNRHAFEKAMDVKEDEVLPVASPLGYPASKRSLREGLMRKGIKADERLNFEELYYDGSFEKRLSKEKAGDFAEALELVRLAPSAVNKQPWRAVVDGDKVYFFEQKTIKDSPLGDVQKVDMGIALAHFDLTRKEDGIDGEFVHSDPGLVLPENMHYILTFERKK